MNWDNKVPDHLRKVSPTVQKMGKVTEEEDEDNIPVAIGRIGNKPQNTVKFVPHDAPAERFDFSHFYRLVEAEVNTVLVVEFTGHTVRIEGHNLAKLEDWLGDRKAKLVKAQPEKQRAAGFVESGEPEVYRIKIEAIRRG